MKLIYLFFTLILLMSISACNKTSSKQESSDKVAMETVADSAMAPKITFIELGSVNCVPCKKMQPIMKSIEKNYGSQVKVIFYDVWKEEYKAKSVEYGIRLIPTQIFLDDNGKEILRHEGYYPEKEIDKFLHSRGINKNS